MAAPDGPRDGQLQIIDCVKRVTSQGLQSNEDVDNTDERKQYDHFSFENVALYHADVAQEAQVS